MGLSRQIQTADTNYICKLLVQDTSYRCKCPAKQKSCYLNIDFLAMAKAEAMAVCTARHCWDSDSDAWTVLLEETQAQKAHASVASFMRSLVLCVSFEMLQRH